MLHHCIRHLQESLACMHSQADDGGLCAEQGLPLYPEQTADLQRMRRGGESGLATAGAYYDSDPVMLGGGSHAAAGALGPHANLAPSLAALQQLDLYSPAASGLVARAGLPGAPAAHDPWAAQGYPIPGRGGWTQYRTPDTLEVYYHHHLTGQTTWDTPPDWGH